MALLYGAHVLNKAAQFILGIQYTGWLRDKYRRQLSRIRFWNRLLKMPSESLTEKVFFMRLLKIIQKVGQMPL